MDNATQAHGPNGEAASLTPEALEGGSPLSFPQLIDLIRAGNTAETDRSIAMMQAGIHLGCELVGAVQALRTEVHELRGELSKRPPAKVSPQRRTKAAVKKTPTKAPAKKK